MIDWWGPVLVEYYGGTEGNGITIVNSQDWLAHPGTVGRSLVGEIKILDENGRVLPPGDIGSVYFSGGPPFAYHNDPQKTQSAYTPEGWSTLGDVGRLDEEGYLYLTDRKAYMIISGGVNIYPQEAENILITHPAVFDVAVFGVPNEDMGEEVKAVVQLAPGVAADDATREDLIAFCRAKLSALEMPAQHRLRKRIAAHADRQAHETHPARPLLEGCEAIFYSSPHDERSRNPHHERQAHPMNLPATSLAVVPPRRGGIGRSG